MAQTQDLTNAFNLTTIASPCDNGSGAVKIFYAEDEDGTKKIVAEHPFNDLFITVMRSCGFRYNAGRWEKELTFKTGNKDDRIVEVAIKLLETGFNVTVNKWYETLIGWKQYEPEQKRWIVTNVCDKEHLYIEIDPGFAYITKDALTIEGAEVFDGVGVKVPLGKYDKLIWLAAKHHYKFSPKAQDMVVSSSIADMAVEEPGEAA